MDSSFIITEGKRIGKLKWLKKTPTLLSSFLYSHSKRLLCFFIKNGNYLPEKNGEKQVFEVSL